MNNLSCNVIRDLLPAYIDKLTSNDSNELIESHLENCDDCKEMLDTLSKAVIVDTNEANREIDYLKKIKAKRKKVLLMTALYCTVIFGIIGAIVIKVFVIGEPISFHQIDADMTDEYVGMGTRFNEETNELTIYGEITSGYTAFSGIKVEEAKGLVGVYNVTVYGAERLFDTKDYNRKFEKTIKIPDDNKEWSFYSIGEIPQDTVLFWSNQEYIDKKAEKSLQTLKEFLIINKGFSDETHHLERVWFEEILSEGCFTYDVHTIEDCMNDTLTVEYAVSEDGKKIYYYDFDIKQWVRF